MLNPARCLLSTAKKHDRGEGQSTVLDLTELHVVPLLVPRNNVTSKYPAFF